MAALPTTIRINCPLCEDPIALPTKAGPNKIQGQRLVLDLSADDAPLRAHLKEQHGIDKVARPPKSVSIALAANTEYVVSGGFNVRPATPPDDGTTALQEAVRHARTQPLGRR
ncbi:hypothetical protein [Streptomyces sp. NPDC002692]